MQSLPTQLKVMSFNIRYGTADDGENSWLFRKEAVLDFLGTSGYDVIGLQEVLTGQLHEIRAAHPYYHWIGVGRDDGDSAGEHSAILYDSRKTELLLSDTFWFSETPEVVGSTSWGNTLPRVCTHGNFVVGGQAFSVFNVHIDHASAISRFRSIEMLTRRICSNGSHTPMIVTGDFNEAESGPTIQLMAQAGFQDTYRTVYPDGPEQATYHNWTGAVTGQKIDYIFVSETWKVADTRIIRETPYGRHLSDHYPVVATLEL